MNHFEHFREEDIARNKVLTISWQIFWAHSTIPTAREEIPPEELLEHH
jgi:hypothetical protein